MKLKGWLSMILRVNVVLNRPMLLLTLTDVSTTCAVVLQPMTVRVFIANNVRV